MLKLRNDFDINKKPIKALTHKSIFFEFYSQEYCVLISHTLEIHQMAIFFLPIFTLMLIDIKNIELTCRQKDMF